MSSPPVARPAAPRAPTSLRACSRLRCAAALARCSQDRARAWSLWAFQSGSVNTIWRTLVNTGARTWCAHLVLSRRARACGWSFLCLREPERLILLLVLYGRLCEERRERQR
jgi:hypothetical protein